MHPTYTPIKPKEPPVDKEKIKLANSLFQQVINPAPKFKGPEMKKKNVQNGIMQPEPTTNTKPSAPVKQVASAPQPNNKPTKKIETTELLDLLWSLLPHKDMY